MTAPLTLTAGANLPAPPPLEAGQALFLDFDGTLVEIASAPDRVRVTAQLPELLDRLARRLDGAVAVISGRSIDELARLLPPFAGALAGLHGLERRMSDGRVTRPVPAARLARARRLLADFAAVRPGVLLEDKGAGLALHYRGAPGSAAACREVAGRAAELVGEEIALIEGKMVFELRPHDADKGRAITAFLAEPPFRGRRPVFIGDDRTDEDGFAEVNRLDGLSICVGAPGTTAARFRLPTVVDVLDWLADAAHRFAQDRTRRL
jgi:trehalose 6-phosphate phosphatase